MQNKDKGDGIEDSPLDMLLVILLDGASKEVVMSSSIKFFIWWGDKRVRMIRYSKIWLRLYFGWTNSGQSKSSHFQLRLHFG